MAECSSESRPHCAGNFGFEGACQCTFTEGGFFGGSLNTDVGPTGSPQENGFVEGQLMTFRVERREKTANAFAAFPKGPLFRYQNEICMPCVSADRRHNFHVLGVRAACVHVRVECCGDLNWMAAASRDLLHLRLAGRPSRLDYPKDLQKLRCHQQTVRKF